MSNDAFRDILYIALRDAKIEKDGEALLMRAKQAAGTRTIQDLLYDIILGTCRKRTDNALTDQERFFLWGLLTEILRGRDVAGALRIDRPKVGHRKRSELSESIWKTANILRRDGFHKSNTAAMKEIAQVLGMKYENVREHYKVGAKRAGGKA